MSPNHFFYRKDSWSGRDLVSNSDRWQTTVKNTTRLWGSDRVRDLATREKWTNILFEDVESQAGLDSRLPRWGWS